MQEATARLRAIPRKAVCALMSLAMAATMVVAPAATQAAYASCACYVYLYVVGADTSDFPSTISYSGKLSDGQSISNSISASGYDEWDSEKSDVSFTSLSAESVPGYTCSISYGGTSGERWAEIEYTKSGSSSGGGSSSDGGSSSGGGSGSTSAVYYYEVYVTWNDNNDAAGLRPTSVTGYWDLSDGSSMSLIASKNGDSNSWYNDTTITQAEGVTITSAQGESVPGYTCSASYDNEYDSINLVYTLTASFTVTFDANGGSGGTSKSATSGSSVTAPSDPTRSGYTFAGWYTAATGGSKVSFPYTVTGTTTLYAHWTANAPVVTTYTVTFNMNGGSGANVTRSVTAGSSMSAPSDPTRSGYTFAGWSLMANGSTGTVSFPYTPGNNITLYAQWTENAKTITVTFDANGGSGGTSKSATSGSSVTAPSDPTRSGYTFAGWFNNTGNAVSFPYAVSDDITFKAAWSLNAGATLTAGSGNYVNGDNTYILDGTYTVVDKDGKKYTVTVSWPVEDKTDAFDYAEIDAAGFTIYTTSGQVTSPTLTPVSETYTVTFDANGGSGGTSKSATAGSSVSAPSDPTRSGYTFAGWYTAATGGSKVTFPYTVTETTTLYAHWTADAPVVTTYTVTFDANGGELEGDATVSGPAGTAVPEPTVSYSGHKLDGWYISGTSYKVTFPYYLGGATNPDAGGVIMPAAENTKLVAKWVEDSSPKPETATSGTISFDKAKPGEESEANADLAGKTLKGTFTVTAGKATLTANIDMSEWSEKGFDHAVLVDSDSDGAVDGVEVFDADGKSKVYAAEVSGETAKTYDGTIAFDKDGKFTPSENVVLDGTYTATDSDGKTYTVKIEWPSSKSDPLESATLKDGVVTITTATGKTATFKAEEKTTPAEPEVKLPSWMTGAGFTDENCTYDEKTRTITLTENVVLVKTLEVPADMADLTIDLNGHTLTGPADGPAVKVLGGQTDLTVKGQGTLTGAAGQSAVDMSASTGSTLTVSDKAIVKGGNGADAAADNADGADGAPAVKGSDKLVVVISGAGTIVLGGNGGAAKGDGNGGAGAAGIDGAASVKVDGGLVSGGAGGTAPGKGNGGKGGDAVKGVPDNRVTYVNAGIATGGKGGASASGQAGKDGSKTSQTTNPSDQKKVKKATKVTLKAKKVTAKKVTKAVKKAKTTKKSVKAVVLGKKVKTVKKGSFKSLKKAKTLVVKTKKLTKKSIKKALKGSKIKTVKVQVSKKASVNKKYAKKYKKLFTKKVCGKKAKVKTAKAK